MSSDPILELGAPGEWDSGTIYAAPDMVHLPDGRLALPYAAATPTHNQAHPEYYGEPMDEKFQLAWATWDDGRLAGLEAEERGEFWSSNLGTFEGTQIAINARTPRHGKVEVALLEPHGRGTKPLPGYTFADCIPFSGDVIWEPLKWKGKSSLEALRGKELILHFRLTSAKNLRHSIHRLTPHPSPRGVQPNEKLRALSPWPRHAGARVPRAVRIAVRGGCFRSRLQAASARSASIGSGDGDCAPAPSHTTGHTVFRIRRLDPATLPARRKIRWHHKPVALQSDVRQPRVQQRVACHTPGSPTRRYRTQQPLAHPQPP